MLAIALGYEDLVDHDALRCDPVPGVVPGRLEGGMEQSQDGGIRAKAPKTSAGRHTISLPAFVVDAMRQHRRDQLKLRVAFGAGKLPPAAPVFSTIDGEPLPPDTTSQCWRDTVKTRKLPKVTFHALRHGHASVLFAAGLDAVSVSRRLGHASLLSRPRSTATSS